MTIFIEKIIYFSKNMVVSLDELFDGIKVNFMCFYITLSLSFSSCKLKLPNVMMGTENWERDCEHSH